MNYLSDIHITTTKQQTSVKNNIHDSKPLFVYAHAYTRMGGGTPFSYVCAYAAQTNGGGTPFSYVHAYAAQMNGGGTPFRTCTRTRTTKGGGDTHLLHKIANY